MSDDKLIMIGLRIPDGWNRLLRQLAAQEYLKKSDIIRRAIREYLDKHPTGETRGGK